MSKLQRNLIRDLVTSKGLFLAVAAVILQGVAIFGASSTGYHNLKHSYDYSYETLRFADFTVEVVAAPSETADELESIPGVDAVSGRVNADIPITLPSDEARIAVLDLIQEMTAKNDEQAIKLTDNARVVLMKRYVRRGPDGKPSETVEGMFRRVARAVAEPDRDHGADTGATEQAFYQLLTELRFFPNSPTFTGAGTPLEQLAACFVLPISDDMGRDSAGIFQTLRDAALIQQTGGGNGFSFGRLRPKGTYVASSAGQATGPVGFLRVYDKPFGEIAPSPAARPR